MIDHRPLLVAALGLERAEAILTDAEAQCDADDDVADTITRDVATRAYVMGALAGVPELERGTVAWAAMHGIAEWCRAEHEARGLDHPSSEVCPGDHAHARMAETVTDTIMRAVQG